MTEHDEVRIAAQADAALRASGFAADGLPREIEPPPRDWFRFHLSTLLFLPVALALVGAWRGREMALHLPWVLYAALTWNWCRLLLKLPFIEALARAAGFVATGLFGTVSGGFCVGVLFTAFNVSSRLATATAWQCAGFAGLAAVAAAPGYWFTGIANRPWIYCARWSFPATWLAAISFEAWLRPQPLQPERQVLLLLFSWIVAPVLFAVGLAADYYRWRKGRRKAADRSRLDDLRRQREQLPRFAPAPRAAEPVADQERRDTI